MGNNGRYHPHDADDVDDREVWALLSHRRGVTACHYAHLGVGGDGDGCQC